MKSNPCCKAVFTGRFRKVRFVRLFPVRLAVVQLKRGWRENSAGSHQSQNLHLVKNFRLWGMEPEQKKQKTALRLYIMLLTIMWFLFVYLLCTVMYIISSLRSIAQPRQDLALARVFVFACFHEKVGVMGADLDFCLFGILNFACAFLTFRHGHYKLKLIAIYSVEINNKLDGYNISEISMKHWKQTLSDLMTNVFPLRIVCPRYKLSKECCGRLAFFMIYRPQRRPKCWKFSVHSLLCAFGNGEWCVWPKNSDLFMIFSLSSWV